VARDIWKGTSTHTILQTLLLVASHTVSRSTSSNSINQAPWSLRPINPVRNLLFYAIFPILIFHFHLLPYLPNGLLLLGFQTKILYAFLFCSILASVFPPHTPCFDDQYHLMKRTSCEVFSSFLSRPSSWIQIFPIAPCSQIPSVLCSFLNVSDQIPHPYKN
jgi:hypothetical protein